MAGRGSFIESFPLFGYDLRDYDELFTEKLDLLLAIRDDERVTWQGEHRAPLEDAVVWPRPVQDRLPIWVAVGGSPESVVRAASRGLPLALAIIGGQTARFKPFVDLYRHAWVETGQVGEPRIAINTHAFIADSRRQADAAFAAPYLDVMNRIGRERGWPPSGRTVRGPRGSVRPARARLARRGRREDHLVPRDLRARALPRPHRHRRRLAHRRHAGNSQALRNPGGADRRVRDATCRRSSVIPDPSRGGWTDGHTEREAGEAQQRRYGSTPAPCSVRRPRDRARRASRARSPPPHASPRRSSANGPGRRRSADR